MTRSAQHRRVEARGTVAIALTFALVLAVIIGGPPLVRYLKAPTITESFGLEDAVAALRLDAHDRSYLVLVNEAGDTRSALLEERGFERSTLLWTEAGLSTGDPTHEYLLRADDLVQMDLATPREKQESLSERTRVATANGFAVLNGSAHGQQLVMVDAAAGGATALDIGYVNPEIASCGDSVVMVDGSGIHEVTPEANDFDRFGPFDDVEQLVCFDGRVFGLGDVSDDPQPTQLLRVWNQESGAPVEYLVRYPDRVQGWAPSSSFVQDGRLFWAVEGYLWSVELPAPDSAETGRTTVLEAEESGDLSGSIRGTDGSTLHSGVAGFGSEVVAPAAGKVFSVAADETWVQRRKSRSFDRFDSMLIFSVDPVSGERRVEVEIDRVDFPRREFSVHAIAVNPDWAATR